VTSKIVRQQSRPSAVPAIVCRRCPIYRGGVSDSSAIARGVAVPQITAAGRRPTRERRGR
jgi:hypothetical protein